MIPSTEIEKSIDGGIKAGSQSIVFRVATPSENKNE